MWEEDQQTHSCLKCHCIYDTFPVNSRWFIKLNLQPKRAERPRLQWTPVHKCVSMHLCVCVCAIPAGLHPYFMTDKGFGSCVHFPRAAL